MIDFKVPDNLQIYNVSDITDILDCIGNIDLVADMKDKKSFKYNIPCSFDIETSSFLQDGEKRACLVCWSFCILHYVIFGRTWEELEALTGALKDKLHLTLKRRLVVYVHNLQYEFQWIRRRFEWYKVFSVDTRKPIYAITTDGIEFRCSLILSGYNLATVGENLTTYKVFKQVGAWDYDLIRHTNTVLSDDEIRYSCYDVLVVCAYIQEAIEKNGDISKIPYTKTGYVRNEVRHECFKNTGADRDPYQYYYYSHLMQGYTIELDELQMLKDSFQGGFTHSNPNHTNKIMYGVDSQDFTSCYPFCAVAYAEYPYGKGYAYKVKNKEDFIKQITKYACVFEVYFENFESKTTYDFYISSSHCKVLDNPTLSNGRVVRADAISFTITNIDYDTISHLYKWDKMKIGKMYRYHKGYLPTEIVRSILKFYEQKTSLKNVKGKEIEYLAGKENINSIYGMMAMYPIRELYEYDNEWLKPTTPDIEETLSKYNNNRGRFITYSWATFLTALARRNLWSAIFELKNDYIYADTDSVKYVNHEAHKTYFERYNNNCITLLNLAMNHHNIPIDAYKPKTIKGIEKILGIWDRETTDDNRYKRFKTLGAKRYLYEDNDGLHITVAGLSKQTAVNFLCMGWSINRTTKEETNNPFDKFEDGLYIPPEYTGKKIHSYIDDEIGGVVVDYKGNKAYYHELSCIHLAPCEYRLPVPLRPVGPIIRPSQCQVKPLDKTTPHYYHIIDGLLIHCHCSPFGLARRIILLNTTRILKEG